MHITYRYEKRLTHVPISTSQSKVAPKAIMSIIDERITALRKEQNRIRQICVKLSGFIKANAITPFNDDFLEYLRHFLNEEKQKQMHSHANEALIDNLERSIHEYEQDLQLYIRSVEKADVDEFVDPNEIDKIFELVSNLYELPINGKSIQEQMERVKQEQIATVERDECVIDLPPEKIYSNSLHQLQALMKKK